MFHLVIIQICQQRKPIDIKCRLLNVNILFYKICNYIDAHTMTRYMKFNVEYIFSAMHIRVLHIADTSVQCACRCRCRCPAFRALVAIMHLVNWMVGNLHSIFLLAKCQIVENPFVAAWPIFQTWIREHSRENINKILNWIYYGAFAIGFYYMFPNGEYRKTYFIFNLCILHQTSALFINLLTHFGYWLALFSNIPVVRPEKIRKTPTINE